jgi:hypothetical protein
MSKSASNIQLMMTSVESAETILHDDESEETHQCSICMESFNSNDLVSWSPLSECNHVFHHTCIKTWLLHHECCPYCRVCILSVDQRNVSRTHTSTELGDISSSVVENPNPKQVKQWGKERLKELAQQRHQRLVSTYYCSKEGLVTLNQPLRTKTTSINDCVETNSSSDLPIHRTIDLSLKTMKRFLMSDAVQPHEMIALRTHPKSIRCTSDVVVTITSPHNVGMDMSTFTTNDGATTDNNNNNNNNNNNVGIDIETTMKELPIISNDGTD